MKIINRIKRLFKRNSITMTNSKDIVLYGISLSEIPEFDSLDDNDKEKVINYMNDIDINNLEKLINYNIDIPKETKVLSELLTQYLERINEVTRLDDKDEYGIEKMHIDLIIKNIQVSIIKKLLDDYLYESKLITRAAMMYKDEFLKKEFRSITYFSRAAQFRRNSQIQSLNNIISNCMLTVTVLDQHLKASNNAIKSNYNLIDSVNVFNNVISQTLINDYRMEIYKQKYYSFVRIRDLFKWDFFKLSELEQLLNEPLDYDNEKEIINILSHLEVELDKYVKMNTEELYDYFKSNIDPDKIRKMITISTSNDEIYFYNIPINELFEIFEKLHIISLLIPDMVNVYQKTLISKVLFSIMTKNIDEDNKLYESFINNPYCFLRDSKLVDDFIEIIINRIYKINDGTNEIAKRFKSEHKIKALIDALAIYFKDNDGKYDYKGILFSKEKLVLLLSFKDQDHFCNLFDKKFVSKDSIGLKDGEFLEWEDYLPRKTVYYLYEITGLISSLKPLYYEIYNACKDNNGMINPYLLPSFYFNSYNFPYGIKRIQFDSDEYKYVKKRNNLIWPEYLSDLSEGIISSDLIDHKQNPLSDPHELYPIVIDAIRKDSNNCDLIIPNSLKSISGNVFGNSIIKKVTSSFSLEDIGDNSFINQKTNFVEIFHNVSNLSFKAFNYENIILRFYYYQLSIILYKLMFSDDKEILDFIRHIAFLSCGSSEYLNEMISVNKGDPTVSPSVTFNFITKRRVLSKMYVSNRSFSDSFVKNFQRTLAETICNKLEIPISEFYKFQESSNSNQCMKKELLKTDNELKK